MPAARMVDMEQFGVAALALVVTFLAGEAVQPPFLRPVSGSTLELSERALADSSRVHHLVPADLANIVCYYAGFRPNRLRAEITRNGTVLAPFDLSPQGDPQAGTLLLSDAQESWSQVVQGLLRASKEGPVDLVLVVPGTALVRAVRVRVDQQSPTVAARLLEPERGLCADSRLLVELQDDTGVAEACVLVQFEFLDCKASEFIQAMTLCCRARFERKMFANVTCVDLKECSDLYILVLG